MIYRVYISTSAVMIQREWKDFRCGDFALVFKALPRPLFTRKTFNKTIKGVDVPREEQPALTTVSTGVCHLLKKCL